MSMGVEFSFLKNSFRLNVDGCRVLSFKKLFPAQFLWACYKISEFPHFQNIHAHTQAQHSWTYVYTN